MKFFAFALLVLLSLSAGAQDPAGHYVLQGVIEVGSELLLKPDGTFEYMLAYGAADYWAKAPGSATATPSSCTVPASAQNPSCFCAAKRASQAGSAFG